MSCPLELGKAAGVVTSRVQIWGADTKMACVRNHGVVIPLAVFETDDVPPLFFVYEGRQKVTVPSFETFKWPCLGRVWLQAVNFLKKHFFIFEVLNIN